MCGCIFQSSRTLSERVVNSEVTELRGIQQRRRALQENNFVTLIYKLENYNVLVEYLYKSQNRSGGTSA